VRRQDLLVNAGSSFAESEALKSVGAVSLGVYPILVDGVLGGCLYFDRLSVRPPPAARTLELLATLRDLAARPSRYGDRGLNRAGPGSGQSDDHLGHAVLVTLQLS